MSSRPSSRACVPWGVSFFLSGCLSLLARIVLIRLVGRLVSHLVHRLVLLARLVSSYLRFPGGVSSYPRVSVPSSRHIVLLGRRACSSRFSFHSSYRLAGME